MRTSTAAAAGCAVVVGLTLHGLGVVGGATGGLGAASGYPPPAERVLVVSVPRLTWEDMERFHLDCAGSVEPVCAWVEGLGDAGATNSLRAIGPLTSLSEGYLTFGAGNRATLPDETVHEVESAPDGGVVSLALPAAVADADDKLYGAEPGAFGQALEDAGLTTAVVAAGPDAVMALMDTDGHVDDASLGVSDPAEASRRAGSMLDRHDVVLVELAGLETVASPDASDPVRRRVVDASLRSAFSTVVDAASPGTLLVLMTPAPPLDRGRLGVVAVQGATMSPADTTVERGPGSVLQSATTRRAAYVALTDLAPTVLERLGVEVPRSITGTPAVSTSRTAAVGDMARLDRRSLYRDSLVGPISVVYVVLQVLSAVAAMWAIRHQGRWSNAVAAAAGTVVLVPPVAFLSGAVAFERLPKPLYVIGIFVVAGAMSVAAILTARRRGRPSWSPVLAMVAVALAVQWVDITTGGRLQIDTPFGYSPIVAGRFQGFGNLSFAMASTAALVVASAASLVRPRLAPGLSLVWAATIGGVMVVTDGLPAFGADVGGVLALIPAIVVLVTVLSGRRVGVGRLLLAGAVAVAVLVAVAAFDMSRPESEQTHLGRFVGRLLDGEAGLILRRKISANIGILTSSVWTWLVPVIVVFFVVVARRRGGVVARLGAEVPGVRAFLASALVLAVVGFAVNDSGVAIPAAMSGLVLPWITVLALSVPSAAASERAP